MPATLGFPNDEVAILGRAVEPTNWRLTPEAAQAILSLNLATADKHRMDELAVKARAGELTADEEIEIENYRQVGCLIELLKSKSRQFLRGSGR
jgi:hypothetical protein